MTDKITRLIISFFSIMSFLILSGGDFLWAGPPFITDDPEPVELHHWEFYLASQYLSNNEITGSVPQIEVNYGAMPETQLHIIVPGTYIVTSDNTTLYGLGDIELGIKYRFVPETDSFPQVGTFPHIELPSGDNSRGLGAGKTTVFLPIWVQKSWGPWTTYGGGGFWYNNIGNGNQNYWQAGWEIQRDISEHVTLGTELFSLSSRSATGSSETGYNIGTIIDFDEKHHLLFSAGSDLSGSTNLLIYIAFQWTFGPKIPTDNLHVK